MIYKESYIKMMANESINSFKLLSHSEPDRKLVVHLDEVYKKAKRRLEELNINFRHLKISRNEFENLLKISIYCHDFGKASSYFQKKITNGLDSVKEKKLSEHGLISAFFGYFIAMNKFNNKRLASFVFMAIRYHHLNLENADEMQRVNESDIEKVLKIFEAIKPNKKEVDKIYEKFLGIKNCMQQFEEFLKSNFPEDELEYLTRYFWYKQEYMDNDIFVFLLLFSLLIYADKQDAIFRDIKIKTIQDLKIDSNKVDLFKKIYFKDRKKTPLDEVREKIYQDLVNEFINKEVNNKNIFFIKLPTGAGKTLLLYKLALMISEKYNIQKIFYLLPFITLIEQNAQIFKELLEYMNINTNNNLIFLEKHSLSGEFELDEKSEDEYDVDIKQFLDDTLESRFIVTSFHQLFYGIFKRKNSLLKRFHQFINSVILIDEVQLIPLEHMYIITQFLKFMTEIFNCKIIVASATLPNINKEILKNSYTFKEIDKIISNDEVDKFFNRYKININLSKVYSKKSLFEKVDEKLQTKRDLLFRVNTVNIANEIYDYITSISTDYEKDNIFLLTSAIAPKIRKKIIKKIKTNTTNGNRQIVVATQLIQAGVDISLEDGFEELAPLDLLVQSMGRRNRSAEKKEMGKADVIKIAQIVNNRKFEGYRIYNQYDIKQTIKILSKYKSLTEKEIYKNRLLEEYYNLQIEIKKIDKDLKKLNFKNIDKDFALIKDAPLSYSFFMPLDENAKKLWKQLVELDKRKKEIKKDKNFWKNLKEIESEYSKIKKDVSLYVVNQNLYYWGEKKEIVNLIITKNFESALNIYLAPEEIFDKKRGLQLNKYLKDKIECLFW